MKGNYAHWARFPRWTPMVLGVLLAAAAVSIVPGAISDTTADLVLGQRDFAHFMANFVDAKGVSAPEGIAIDSTVSPHRVYVADRLNNRVLRFPNSAAFLNGEAADLVLGQADFFSVSENQGGAVGAATLSGPVAVRVDSAGDVFVADPGNNRVVEYLPPLANGKAAAVALGQPTLTSGKCGVTSATTLCNPQGVAVDAAGDVLVSDDNNSRVLFYSHGSIKTGAAATQAVGQPDLVSGGCNGPGQNVLCNPEGIAIDPLSGKLWVADNQNNRVVRFGSIVTNASAELVLGQPDFTHGACNQGQANPQMQTLCSPAAVAVDTTGNVYVADFFNNRVVEFNTPTVNDPDFAVFFGQIDATSNACNQFGIGANSLCSPSGIALDGVNVFISDQANNRLLEYDAPLVNGTTAARVLGQIDFTHLTSNFIDALGMNTPQSVAIDTSVIPNRVYVTDTGNNRILGYHSVAALVSGAPADLVIGQPDLFSGGCNSGNFPNVDADTLCGPQGIAVDGAGNLYVADPGNNRVLEFDHPFTSDGFADRVYGQGGSFFTNLCNLSSSSGATPTASTLCLPFSVAIDPKGNLYVADSGNNRVVEYNNPLTNSTANLIFGQFGFAITSHCNFGMAAPTPDTLCFPVAVRTDSAGNLYVADSSNSRVLEYDTPLSSPNESPTADLVFGQGGSMFSGVDNYGGLSFDSLSRPADVAIDAAGNVYIADQGNARTLQYNRPLLTRSTSAARVFGQAGFFKAGCNVGGVSANSQCFTSGVALDSSANLYVADSGNNRVLVYDQPLAVPTPTPSRTSTPSPTHTPAPTPSHTPVPTPSRTPSRTATATPTRTPVHTPSPTPTPAVPAPGIDSIDSPVMAGADMVIRGDGFNAGSMVNFFISTAAGAVNAGPLKPSAIAANWLVVPIDAGVPQGEGYVNVQVVNTTEGFIKSNPMGTMLQGAEAAGLPSITGINGAGLAPNSSDPAIAVANVETVVPLGKPFVIAGRGFDTVHGVAVDVFCACPGGKVGPFLLKPGQFNSTQLRLTLPASGPNAPAVGPGSLRVSNQGADGSYRQQSAAVAVPLGAGISVTSVTQAGPLITVRGTGFSSATVINFFSRQGLGVVNLGGLRAGGGPRIALAPVTPTGFVFVVPAGAQPGPSYVQAINPPFVPYSSSGNDAGGSFTLR